MTTLELAEKIAAGVIQAHLNYRSYRDASLAVLQVLHANDSWFCRNPTGDEWHEEHEQRYDDVQLDLFK